ncbi:hypothetical protein FOA52_005221 [Chlamydomonas sp. UWO 241]|nr:hypothetical protein FOA52_005221 [Chlamydomonas sp. UWO 241]
MHWCPRPGLSATMDTVLPAFGFQTEVPLIVETYWDDVDPQSVEMQAVTRLMNRGYQVVVSPSGCGDTA